MMENTSKVFALLGLCLLMSITTGAHAQYATLIRERGYCAMYDNCGQANDTVAVGDLPCANNTLAVDTTTPTDMPFRNEIVEYCGPEFSVDLMPGICCTLDQYNTMKSMVEKALAFVRSCPACAQNMKALYCFMTCSPDQSLFYNVTSWGPDPSGSGKISVLSAAFWVSDDFGTGFYDSCKEVKYGMSNADAMLFIGGGADNYLEMLEYMGEPKDLGSPFEIYFPNVTDPDDFGDDPRIIPLNPPHYPCTHDGQYRCVCVDCPDACRVAEPIEDESFSCYVGSLNCLSFTLIIIYSLLFAASVAMLIFRGKNSKGEYEAVAEAQLPKEWKLYTRMQRFYYYLGHWVARHPSLVLLISILVLEVFWLGLINFQVMTDPVELWVAVDSDTREQKAFFDENFNPFYRTQQYILSKPSDKKVIQFDHISRMFDIEDGVSRIVVPNLTYDGKNVTLDTLCFKPLGDTCVITSVTGYWQGNKETFLKDENWYQHLETCVNNPSFPGDDDEVPCLPSFMDPIRPELSLGGFVDDDYLNAEAFVATFVINNRLDEEYISAATEWELLLVEYLKSVAAEAEAEADLRITYYTESGVEEELMRASSADVITIAISYLVMFLYVSIALGKFTSWRRFFIDTKFTLGIAGVLLCIASVFAAVGIFSAFGVKTSLIIAEVIPFLVLAVGVDNIFIMVNTFEALDKSRPIPERCAATMSEIGPTITLSAGAETVAFALGTIVSMPAVNSFAGYSAVAVGLDFLLQITCFLALIAVDARRKETKRPDLFPCVTVNVQDPTPEELSHHGFLQVFVERYYSPFLVHPITRFIAVFGTLAMMVALASFIPQVELGLDQTVALPQDSYLIPYFNDQANLLEIGAPVYFVVRDGNSTTIEGKQELCYTYRNCSDDSVANIIAEEARRSEESYIALASASWIDDYMAWLNPSNPLCCRETPLGEFCQATDTNPLCRLCYNVRDYERLVFGPVGLDFMKYLEFWLQAIPGTDCAFAGAAAYGDAVVPDYVLTNVNASHFRTYHNVLVTQADYIAAYKSAIRISERIMEQQPHLDVFPYSIWYVYFEQYLTIVPTTFLVLSVALLAVFCVTWLILGSLLSAVFVCVTVLMIVVDLAGVMALWGITLNALSLVNLVMALGISVEFCSHIVRAYTTAVGTRPERSMHALNEIGASVFSGITITKFLGVIVLAFAQSMIFVIYYFRMYISIVFLGFIHGLVFLPALLAYVGPPSVAKSSPVESTTRLTEVEKESMQIQQRLSIYGSA